MASALLYAVSYSLRSIASSPVFIMITTTSFSGVMNAVLSKLLLPLIVALTLTDPAGTYLLHEGIVTRNTTNKHACYIVGWVDMYMHSSSVLHRN